MSATINGREYILEPELVPGKAWRVVIKTGSKRKGTRIAYPVSEPCYTLAQAQAFVNNNRAAHFAAVVTERGQIMEYNVIVGNIGTVYTGTNRRGAYAAFREYRNQSAGDYGRAARETVAILAGGNMLREYRPPTKLPLIKDIRALLIALKPTIGDEYRADEFSADDTTPSMLVTIGADESGGWSWQTGDNSYSGGAYHYPHWAVIALTRRANCTELARDAIDQIAELIAS